MPSSSKKQARLMAACSHGAGYPSCPPVKVSKDFNAADRGSERLSSPGGLVQRGSYLEKKHA